MAWLLFMLAMVFIGLVAFGAGDYSGRSRAWDIAYEEGRRAGFEAGHETGEERGFDKGVEEGKALGTRFERERWQRELCAVEDQLGRVIDCPWEN